MRVTLLGPMPAPPRLRVWPRRRHSKLRQARLQRELCDRAAARKGPSAPLLRWGLTDMDTMTAHIAEEMRRRPSQAADARQNDDALPQGIGRMPNPQRSSPVGTQAAGDMRPADTPGQASPAVTSDDGSTLVIILLLGLAGEVIVPWGVIELSNWLLFDVPLWALVPIFAGPITLALATALTLWLVRTQRSRTEHRRDSRHGRDGGEGG